MGLKMALLHQNHACHQILGICTLFLALKKKKKVEVAAFGA